jgi:hypothetical protein
MKLIHKATGTIIEVPCLIQGGEWEKVEEKKPAPKKKATKKKTAKKGK